MAIGRKSFTLVELIMVIIVLSVLAIVAVARFFNLSNDAINSAEQAVVASVQTGISNTYANNLVQGITPAYPASLDGGAPGETCGVVFSCFSNVLGQDGVTDSRWMKGSGGTYTHSGVNMSTYTYNNTTGTFQCTANCP